MKPEPLKGRLFKVPLSIHDAHYEEMGGAKADTIKVATDGQIRSAVEWLKTRLNELEMKPERQEDIYPSFKKGKRKIHKPIWRQTSISYNAALNKSITIISEAFEDVTKV